MKIIRKLFNKLFFQIFEEFNKLNKRLDNLNSQVSKIKIMLWMLQKENPKTLEETQKTFWLNYPKASGDLRIIQTGNMFVLKAMKEICDENDIKFWLHGGTLIGAVRHQGCIPWDDDVDVAMTRADLEKFAKVCEDNSDYELNFYYHDDANFSRAYQFKRRKQEIPCFIDIFVFDYYSYSGEDYIHAHSVFQKKFAEIRGQMVREYLQNPLVAEDIGCYHFGPFNKENKIIADRIIDNNIEKISPNRYEGNSLYYSIENYPFAYPLFTLDKIFPLQKMPFEGIECYVPADSDFYLKGYGDYWQMPSDLGLPAHIDYYESHIPAIQEFITRNHFTLNRGG